MLIKLAHYIIANNEYEQGRNGAYEEKVFGGLAEEEALHAVLEHEGPLVDVVHSGVPASADEPNISMCRMREQCADQK